MQFLRAHKRRPFVLDLTLPGDHLSPVGSWLADRISESLARIHPELEVVPRIKAVSNDPVLSPQNGNQSDAEQSKPNRPSAIVDEQTIRALGAEVAVRGDFAVVAAGLGITLKASDLLSPEESPIEVLGEVALCPELQPIHDDPLPERTLIEGLYKAGSAGIGSPTCLRCPPPEYSYVARAKRWTGVVVLDVKVSAHGDVESVRVARTPYPALATAAMRAVKFWRFEPSTNAQGDAVAVIAKVALNFQLATNVVIQAKREEKPGQ